MAHGLVLQNKRDPVGLRREVFRYRELPFPTRPASGAPSRSCKLWIKGRRSVWRRVVRRNIRLDNSCPDRYHLTGSWLRARFRWAVASGCVCPSDRQGRGSAGAERPRASTFHCSGMHPYGHRTHRTRPAPLRLPRAGGVPRPLADVRLPPRPGGGAVLPVRPDAAAVQRAAAAPGRPPRLAPHPGTGRPARLSCPRCDPAARQAGRAQA